MTLPERLCDTSGCRPPSNAWQNLRATALEAATARRAGAVGRPCSGRHCARHLQRRHDSRQPAPWQPKRSSPRASQSRRAAAVPSASCNRGYAEVSWKSRLPSAAQLRGECGRRRRERSVGAPRAWSALASTCSNSTTRPPRSPVASCAPVASNSTAEIMSAANKASASRVSPPQNGACRAQAAREAFRVSPHTAVHPHATAFPARRGRAGAGGVP